MVIQVSKETSPRPFLKWAGGKSRLIQQYIPYFPKSYKNYYEPFLGGGAVFFYLQPSAAILTDINAELINTYCCVRDRVEELIYLLKEHKVRHGKDYYYSVRNNSSGTDIEKAARLIYLNKTCFNGLYRVNSQGKFNVPLGRYENPNICPENLLRLASKALATSKIKHTNFVDVLNYATNSDDFIYFDPPYYPVSETSDFTGYSSYRFAKDQQVELKNVFETLAEHGVKVMLSNSDCEFIREIYSRFNIHTISASRAINSNAKKRGKITELLVTSY
ncbi:DNA adenine methylase [Nostoc sp.]|uniref:DNA adenine methylase n=1 Tax=Nostoc sp. TaxID=1180 RepID=UPI002FF87AFD